MNNIITSLFYYSYLDATQQIGTSYEQVTTQFICTHYNIAQTEALKTIHTLLPSFLDQGHHKKQQYHQVFYQRIPAVTLEY